MGQWVHAKFVFVEANGSGSCSGASVWPVRGADRVVIRFAPTPGYTVWNRNKKSVVLDLLDDGDRAACRRLMATADVVVESFSPGTTERLGIDYSAVRSDNPRAVYCSITAYGRTGASRDRPGYDGLIQARWGLQNEQP